MFLIRFSYHIWDLHFKITGFTSYVDLSNMVNNKYISTNLNCSEKWIGGTVSEIPQEATNLRKRGGGRTIYVCVKSVILNSRLIFDVTWKSYRTRFQKLSKHLGENWIETTSVPVCHPRAKSPNAIEGTFVMPSL